MRLVLHRIRSLSPALAIAVAAVLPSPLPSRAADTATGPMASVLGITPGMSRDEAHRRLERIGKRIEEAADEEQEQAGMEREVWKLRDRRYAWLQLAVDPRHRVRSLQAHLRQPGPGLRYADIGDLSQARRLGLYIYDWSVPRPGGVARHVTARGADSVYAASVTITETGDVRNGRRERELPTEAP